MDKFHDLHLIKYLEAQNIVAPGGSIKEGNSRYAVELAGELSSVDDIENIISYKFLSGDISENSTIFITGKGDQLIFKSKSKITTIGMRHGEKMHETLATKEELVRSEDMGDFLRLSMDTRGLNYEKYLSEGKNN